MINEIKAKKEEGVILDFCEDIFLRHSEVRLNLSRIDVISVHYKHYIDNDVGIHHLQQTGGGSHKQIL